MGQQQLLLVILVTIIVGIATVVAINIFGTAADQANRDAVRQDILAAAAQGQAVYARPGMMGGAGGDFSPASISAEELLRRLNIPGALGTGDSSDRIVNENGEYEASGAGDVLTITGYPASDPNDEIELVLTREADGAWDFSWGDGTGGDSDGETP